MSSSVISFRSFIRVLAMLAVLALFSFMIQNSFIISKGNERIQARQLETLTNMLATQAALSASYMLVNDEQERLLKLTNQLAKDRLVLDATIYDAEGVKLAASENATPVREVLGLDTPLSTASIGRQQLVEPIYHQENLIGFVRITFEKGMVTAISDHHYRNSDRTMYLMLIMSFISGLLISFLLRRHVKRNRAKQRSSEENLLLKQV
ncbi:YtjB family periplasmic protein [Vibrio sp. SCSIO 43136]|uniref:YtjB family periplasmic protein n=1 Tax=Vibrio sp. SCSIO 43136 TaxID=2819101 RepID=UPI002075AC8C|nr:YtjB family periplasmic protein [Vibrio sp. SCSIO 43136]USD64749.1 YtjB family periplasmic protein [Vibrio sp. SCSIO 43136]